MLGQDTDQCATLMPCQNDGRCRMMNDGGYECFCVPGWTGINCTIQVDECASDPCRNGGTCTDLQLDYQCDCLPGFTAEDCFIDIDECGSLPCDNGGTCMNTYGSFVCYCQPGYTGSTCDINIDDCQNDPCQNGANCIDLVNDFQCQCPAGFTGERCETNTDDCASNPCTDSSTCVDLVNGFSCMCIPGFTGSRCETDIDFCDSSPCVNGNCTERIDGFECICEPDYTGTQCEAMINQCDPMPCENNGTCEDLGLTYQCTCNGGYTGVDCEVIICDTDPCLNDGTCESIVGGYMCSCVDGFTGTNCEVNIDDCAGDPCQNNATCMDGINMYDCICVNGYTGQNCDIEINECMPNPCLYGECRDLIGEYECICPVYFTGRQCEIDINECDFGYCQNGATCVERNVTELLVTNDTAYYCICPSGFTGYNCSVNIDDCPPNACTNGGVCVDEIDNYFCRCPEDFIGSRCGLLERLTFMETNSYLALNATIDSTEVTISLNFATSFSSGIVFYARGVSQNMSLATAYIILFFVIQVSNTQFYMINSISLELSYGSLLFKYNSNDNPLLIRLGDQLNDGEYHAVTIQTFNNGSVLLCVDYALCQSSDSVNPGVTFNTELPFYIGGIETTSNESMYYLTTSSSMIGAISNFSIDGELFDLLPNSSSTLGSRNIIVSHQRVDQCDSKPCLNDGQCTDMWFSYECQCAVGFSGEDCGFQYLANFDNHSFLHINDDGQVTSLSLEFSTLSSNGVLLYTGNVSVNVIIVLVSNV